MVNEVRLSDAEAAAASLTDDERRAVCDAILNVALRLHSAHRGERGSEGLRAEVGEEPIERRAVRTRHDHSVMVAGDRQDRRSVMPPGNIELIEIILQFTEMVDHVTEVEEKGRSLGQVACV